MNHVLLHTLWGHRGGLVFVAAGILIFELLLAVVWRSLGEVVATSFFDLLPENMRRLMEAQFGFVPTGGLTGWLAGLNRHPIYLALLASFAIGTGVGAVAKEVERGSILLVLSRPLSRWRFLLGKIGAGAAGLAFLTLVTLAGLMGGILAVGEELETLTFVWVALNSYLLFLVVGGVAVVLSAIGDDAGVVSARAAGIVLTAYFIDFLANLWEKAAFLGPSSFFHYYNPGVLVQTGEVPWGDLGVLTVTVAALYGAAIILFQRRDIRR